MTSTTENLRRGLGECIICGCEMIVGDKSLEGQISVVCPCGHPVHKHCVLQWFSALKAGNPPKPPECPLCRAQSTHCLHVQTDSVLFADNQDQYQPINASVLAAKRLQELQNAIRYARESQARIDRLDKQIQQAETDKKSMNYLRMMIKLKKGITLVPPHEASHFGSESSEMKFLHYLCEKEEKRCSQLLNQREAQNKSLQNLDRDRGMTSVNCEELKTQIKYLKRQCLEQGIDFASALKRVEARHSNNSNNSNNVSSIPTTEVHKISGKIRSRLEAGNENNNTKVPLNSVNNAKVASTTRPPHHQQQTNKKNHHHGQNDDDEESSRRPRNPVEESQNKSFLMMDFLRQECNRTERSPVK